MDGVGWKDKSELDLAASIATHFENRVSSDLIIEVYRRPGLLCTQVCLITQSSVFNTILMDRQWMEIISTHLDTTAEYLPNWVAF